jgi:hypothetical protein
LGYINPDIDWYIGISKQNSVQPRCPYANIHRCYRYYTSLVLLGESGITTKMGSDKVNELESFWANSDLIPDLAEHHTGISISDGKKTGFSNFCPEVSYDFFGLFANSLHRYADEIDSDAAHRQLAKSAYPNDWRWSWANVSPLHYSQCSYYSQILSSPISSPAAQLPVTPEQDIIEVKPGFMGISINLRALITRVAKWWFSILGHIHTCV